MSVNYDGKCEHCGKDRQRVTLDVYIHDIPGTLGSEEWCLECVRGVGKGKKQHKVPVKRSKT